MQVTLDIPDTLAPNLTAAGSDLARSLLELAALKAFESGNLDTAETMRLLHLDSPEQLGALSDSFFWDGSTDEEPEMDAETLAAIQQGIAEADAGRARPAREVFAEIRARYALPR